MTGYRAAGQASVGTTGCAGSAAGDFDVGAPGRPPVLAVPRHARLVPSGLFPDAVLVPGWDGDAVLLTGHGAVQKNRRVLHVGHGFLRAPPVAGRSRRLLSATLSEGRGWAERVRARPEAEWLDAATAARAAAVVARVREARVGGSWWGAAAPVRGCGHQVVFAAPGMTTALLGQALAGGDAGRTVLVGGRGAGAAAARRLGVAVLEGVLDPWPLIEGAGQVYAAPWSDPWLVAGLLGGDAVLLAAAGLLLGTRYVDPFSLRPTTCEGFLDAAAAWRRGRDANRDVACCVGISFWKRRRVTEMLGGSRPPAFRKTAAAAVAAAARRGGGIAVWPSRAPAGLAALAAARDVPVMRVEDGFVRSAGLGADFLPPLSLVLDRVGIYYDATGPSDLEQVLGTAAFDPALLARAAALRARLVAARVTKYNLPSDPQAELAPGSAGRRIVLVPGQVADDRSVLLGGGGVLPGLDLLERVRRRMPEAFIVYKPHPDVEAGHRAGAVADGAVLALADQVLRGGSMADLLSVVDEVHTLTSLTGFEALLRGIGVTTYGRPFYAGWGLTTDMNAPARRGRRLELDELVAGTMILYPRYFDPVSGLACGPETVLDRLADPALRRVGPLVLARRLHGRMVMTVRSMLQASRRGTAG